MNWYQRMRAWWHRRAFGDKPTADSSPVARRQLRLIDLERLARLEDARSDVNRFLGRASTSKRLGLAALAAAETHAALNIYEAVTLEEEAAAQADVAPPKGAES